MLHRTGQSKSLFTPVIESLSCPIICVTVTRILEVKKKRLNILPFSSIGIQFRQKSAKLHPVKTQGVMQGYGEEKWGKKEELYWQTLQAGPSKQLA